MTQAPPLRLHLIGQMAAFDRTGAIPLPKVRKTRALLAILAMAAPRPVLREHVTALLWSKREREQARASLRQCVHELQDFGHILSIGLLQAGRQHLQLDPNVVWVDVKAISCATTADATVLDLMGGDLLEDLVGLDPAFDHWLEVETRRLRDGAASLAGLLLEQQKVPAEVIVAARRLVSIAPNNESGWRQLIKAYLDIGERGIATETFEDCQRTLAARGQSPSAETRALLQQPSTPKLPAVVSPAAGAAPSRKDSGVWLAVAVFRATDPRDEATLSIGLAEEITSALAKFRSVNLIAPGSIAAISHEPPGQGERWRGLDLDFLLDGSIQRDTGRIRVTVRLLDMRAGGEVVWSSRFERTSADLFTLQDEIAAETAAQVDPELMMRESRRAAGRPAQHATAYELLLQAIPAIYRLTAEGYAEAGDALAHAAELAPEDSRIFGWWACWHAFLVGQGWAPDARHAMRRAGELAERAVTLDPSCARALSIAGYVRSFVLHQDIRETIGLHERALALNPNLPFAWVVSSLSLTYAGSHEVAIVRAQQARRLSPFDPHSFFVDSAEMVPRLMLREYETVALLGRRSLALNPAMSATWKGLLSALGHLGRHEEAAEVLGKLLRIEPGFTLAAAAARSPLRREEDRAIYLDGLRKAGLAEA